MTGGRSAPSDPRQRFRRIEKKKKEVDTAASFSTALIANDPARQDELIDIVESIKRGDGVDERYYRSKIDEDYDRFLATYGVIHLHLENKGSDLLLYLVQYEDRVVLVYLGDHGDLSINPPGRVLQALIAGALKQYDKGAAKARADAQALANAAYAADLAEKQKAREAGVARIKSQMKSTLRGVVQTTPDTSSNVGAPTTTVGKSAETGNFVTPPKKR